MFASQATNLVLGDTNRRIDVFIKDLSGKAVAGLRFFGTMHNDSIAGTSGDDTLSGGAGNDTLDGVAGLDTVTYADAVSAVKVSLVLAVRQHTGGGGADHLLNIENLTGSSFNDTLTGDAGANRLDGGGGNDSLTGGTGIDRFVIGAGTDTVTDLGAGGADVVVISAGATVNAKLVAAWSATGDSSNDGTANLTANGYSVNLAATTGTNGWSVSNAGKTAAVALTGSANADSLVGGTGADTLDGGVENDTLTGGAGNDALTGGTGIDRFVIGLGTDTVSDLASGGADVLVVSAGATVNATLAAAWTATSGSSNAGTANLAANGYSVNLAATTEANGWSVSNEGNATAVSLTGSANADTLTGGAGADTLDGGAGNDSLYDDAGANVLTGGAGDDHFSAYGTNSSLIDGGAGTDTLSVNVGTLQGTVVNVEVLLAGRPDNGGLTTATTATFESFDSIASLYGSANGYSVCLRVSDGGALDLSDELGSTAAVIIASDLGNAITTGAGDDWLHGGDGADALDGGAGDDAVYGGEGADTLDGGAGNDTLYDRAGTSILRGGAGDDRFVTYNVDNNLIDGGTGTDTLAAIYATLQGTVVNVEVLQAGSPYSGGATTATTTTFESFDSIASEYGSGSGYAVRLLVSDGGALDLTDELGGTAAFITASDLGNAITTGAADDTLYGGNGADSLDGGAGNDLLDGGAGADTLAGAGGGDTLTGGSGDDSIDGGAGTDSLVGGAGNDIYAVDNLADKVFEVAGGGTDTVLTRLATYSLASLSAVENLSYTGSANFKGRGNALDNALTGGSGNDTLTGGDGNDSLDGGAGADQMVGGLGNDTYMVDNIGDVVKETGLGYDVVLASLPSRSIITLSRDVEELVLLGSADVRGFGNSSANLLRGNAGANGLFGKAGNDTLLGGGGDDLLDGGAGADSMAGGTGSDWYLVDNIGDLVEEGFGEGIDMVVSSVSFTLGDNVENLQLGKASINGTGNGLANRIFGYAGNEMLSGGAGNDTLYGELGKDTLTGGDGADVFFYQSINEGGDRITDFAHGVDYLELNVHESYAWFYAGGLLAGMDLAASQRFVAGSAANKAYGQFIYSASNSTLYWDADGTGVGVKLALASFTAGTVVTASDLRLI